MDAKAALKNLNKDKYVSTMFKEELALLGRIQKEAEEKLAELSKKVLAEVKKPEVPVFDVVMKLREALALLEGRPISGEPKSRKRRTSDDPQPAQQAPVAPKARRAPGSKG